MLYSIIIPCYNSSQTIRKVVELTMQEMERQKRTPYEFVLVDDFSPDNGATVRELEAIASDHDCVKVIELAKNSGQHNAVMAGLNYAEGGAMIAMDDDMQTHPSFLFFLKNLTKALILYMATIHRKNTVHSVTSEAISIICLCGSSSENQKI